MKKQFQSKSVPRGTRTIWRYLSALFILFTFAIGNVWGAVYKTYALSDLTYTAATLTYEVTGLSSDDQKLNKGERKVEVPCATASGTLYLSGTAANADRYASIYGSNGTSYDASRQIAMTSGYNATGIDFTSDDILSEGGKYYILFSSINGSTKYDYKINKFKYVLSAACPSGDDTTAPTLSSSNPANSATDVAVEGTIVLTFSEAIATVDGSKFSLSGATIGTVEIDGSDAKKVNVPYSSAANEATVTLSVAAEAVADAAGNKSAELSDISFTTVAAVTPACPSGISISGTAAYTEGETIELTAALEAGNGDITYTWYKGSIAEGNEVGTNSNVLTIASCATSDEGNYYCIASKGGCEEDAESTAYAVTVEALVACATLTPATSGDAPAVGDEILLQTGSTGGKIVVADKKDASSFSYNSYGLLFNSGGKDSVRVELNHLLKEGSVISLTIVSNGTSERGLNLNKTGKSTVYQAKWTPSASGEEKTFTYTVTGSDGLKNTNKFWLARNNSVFLKSISVYNCGAALYSLSSAIDPVAAEGKATITLSKSLVAAGATATATYSAIDAAYDFDEWVISGATIDNAKANPVTITMGSTDATITLKLKAAEVKKTVTYYDNTTELGTELVVVGKNPTATGIVAPHKLGYSFAGWSTTNGGAVAALNTIVVADDMPLYAVYNAVNCSALSGKIFEVNINVAPAANCTIRSGSGYETSADLIKYGTVSGGIAIAENSSTSNHLIITTTPTVKFAGGNGYVHISFDCALKVGDKIKTTIASQNIAYTTTSSRSTTNYFTKGTDQELTITSGHPLENATEIYLWAASSNGGELTSLQVIRPEKFDVTFNLHGHGTPIAPQSVLDGGKVTKPSDPSESGWDFDGWYATYVADPESYDGAWDFDNDVVTAATELHAKWTEHVSSNDVSLKTLSVNGDAVTIVPSQLVYAVELPFGTTATPTVAATANDENVKAFTITQAAAVDGSATIYVKAEDNTTEATYTINFSVATSKDIQLVFKTGTTPCVGSASTATQILSNNAAVSTYINQITFTNVEGAGDDGAEGSSLNVGKKAGNMFTLSAKAGYALQSMNFLAKIQDATCEYSINGGAWTELASTNTGGDECYAPFSSGTVHEFRLRSTGASGVWIRNMQLTMIEACTPIVVAWDEEPVEFEVGKSGYAIAATANNAGEVAYSSNATSIVDVTASTGVLTIAGLGSATLKAATAEGDGSTYCENGGANIEISKTVNTYYLVTFDAQNETAADEVKYFSGDEAIAQPADPTYSGFDFQGWFDAANGGNPIVWPLTPAASMTVYAQWVAQCAGPSITTQPEDANYLTGRAAAALVCEATAGAAGALTYTWYSCDDAEKTNPVEASATPSTAAAGTYYYFCAVQEEGCDVIVKSDVVTITVADKDAICLAWVNVTGQNAASLDADKSLYAPEIAASGIKSSSTYGGKTGWKFNSDPAALAIEGAPFKAGDIVEVFVTTVSVDKMRVFKANNGTAANVVAEGAANMVQGANRVTLTEDADNLYLLRKNDFGGWNPYVAYVAVYRACAPILNKITVAGVEGAPVANVVTIEVPASTTQSQLEAIAYDWISNNDAWTADPANAPVAANAWEFGVANTVTLTDKDGDQSVYTITVNKAVPSSDATLSALSASAGTLAPAFDPAVLTYTVALPYGTSEVPTLSATKNHVGAADPVIANAAEFVNRKAVSTVTVTAEDGATELTYTVTFNVEKFESTVIWDGSTMSAVATSPVSGFTWAVTGFSSVTNYNATCGAKAYTKCLPSGGSASASRNIALNVPEGYLAKFYIVFGTHSDGNNRGMFIGTTATKTLDESSVLTLYSSSRTNLTAGTSEFVLGAGTWYINPMESEDFYEISATLMPVGYQRNVTEGRMGTVCLPANVEAGYIYGAEVYTLLYWKYGTSYQDCQMVDFEQVDEMQAGYPYMIIPTSDKFAVVYGDETYSGDGVQMSNGFTGTINPIAQADDNVLVGKYGVVNNQIRCLGQGSYSPANRAYIDLSLTPSKEEYEAVNAPAPVQKRRVSLGRQGEQVATGLDAINASEKPMKVMIDGQMYILRGEKIYDAKGQLVK